jgi:hypothetical protein
MHLLQSNVIHERASDKAFAKMEMLFFEIGSNKLELKSGSYGGITEEEMIMVLESNQAELEVWKYIAELIEKSNKN